MKLQRPRARRYLFVANIELTDLQSEARFTDQTSDLSLFGCHVNAGETLPAGIRIRLRIRHTGAQFGALGKIVYASPNTGMGVEFTEIEHNDQLVLEKWIGRLRDAGGRAGERVSSC